ncbi:MAG: 1-aminocyclopropane-1-carboxylate deaminase/D-cysteine desulfhydrase [Nautiliaceae bacterium]
MPSPITPFEFRGHFFHIKRDDLLRPFEGNKVRKFYYFLKNNFPHIKKLISFGSNQSNAMYAMSELCKIKGWEFIYYTHHIPSFLKQNPHGNYLRALQNGAKIIEIGLRGDELRKFVFRLKSKETLVIEEGGRVRESEEGIKILADEINEYCIKNNLRVFLPSGTGTTAYFLAKHLDVEVITTPCVGDREYLKKQFELLGGGKIPTIISPKKKYHFGKLYKHLYFLWQELKDAGVEFDLLYDPIGWEVVLENRLFDVLYIHQGGLYGNESMLRRYKNVKNV